MSVQPSISPGRPRISRGAGRRVAWIDPPNTFQGNDARFNPEHLHPEWIETADPALAALPVAPLAEPAPAGPKLSRKWMATIFASIALHVAIAAWFMMGGFEDEVLVEGGEQVTVVQLGNSDADDVASGSEAITDAMQVTLIPVTDAKPVETIEAQDVAVAETVTPVETETVEPVEEQAAQPAPAETLAEIESQPLAPVQPDLVPEVLATDVPEIVEDVEIVAPVEDKAEPVEEPKKPEPVVKQPVKQAEKKPDPKQARKAAAEKREAERAERRKAAAEAAEKKKAEAAAAKKAADAKKAAQAKAAQSATGVKDGGASNRQKGRADGDVNGSKAGDAGKGKARNAGNAAVTNYPGKVRAKVARAASRIPGSAKRGAKGAVVVNFTVTSSGGVAGVSVARSSGSPAFDAAAVAAVRKAAPFPAIPDGRGSWQFTIPMALR